MYPTYNYESAPLAQLYIGLSAPCGNTDTSYSKRDKEISALYDEGSCSFDMNGTRTHNGYKPTGFKETEF